MAGKSEIKYWLDLWGNGEFELKTIGENEVIEEGTLNALGIAEGDEMWTDKLDKYFEQKHGIKPEQWEVG